MSSADSGSFTSSLPIWINFISFFRMIARARISYTVLNRRGEWASLSCSWIYWEGFFFLCSFSFLGPHQQHIEIPRLGVKSELQLPAYTTDTAMQDSSHTCDLYHSSWQYWVLNPLSEARDPTCILMDNSWVLNPLSHNGNSWEGF